MGTLVPKNMQDAMTSALDAIAAEVGDIDQFVADELGYDVTRMLSGDGNAPGYFSAEQVDALALSIYNIKKGGGFIIGDQTGVGKGRVVAAMMRWAERNNRVPVFLTARAGLFNAMVTDMRDIGWEGDITADTFVTNSDLRGKDALALDSGGVLKAMTPKPYKAAMAELATGKTPDGIKRIFTTYSQMQSVKGAETPRRNMFRAIAPNALFILDESHLAGGAAKSERMREDDDLSRAKFIRDILDQSTGAFFSSATFAKSPTVMSLYAKTDLRLAVADIDNLAGVIEQGGVPMQQVASNMLVQSGQYVRRERSYAGVKFNTTPYKTNMVAAKAGTQAIRSVFDLDRDVMQDVREAFIDELMSEGNGGAIDGAVGEQSATSINFASVMHNVVGQFITAIKADAAAARVIEIIESGRKPIIALSNTNEAIISDFVGDAKEGDEVGEVPFNTILMRYADRLRRITIKDRDTERKRHVVMTDADILRFGGEKALQQFKETRAAIEKMDLTGIPGSPLDHIMDKVVAAGYQMGEITGRKTSVRNGKVSLREPSAAEKNRTMRAYNTGEIEALIINKSGAEGFSLHATGKNGNDGKPRSMIVLQPDADINVFMQLIGRIHRTGQIHLPEYDIAISELAVEKRPAAVLMRKMASLSANTTANKDSVVSLDAVDFMNKYGDRVMREYLDENPDIAYAMDMESLLSSTNEDGERQELSGGDYAAKATGRMAILDPAVAESAFKDIEGAYVALIEELDRAGTNDLEAKTIDLDAKTKSATNLTAGVPESSSAFAAPARFEIADVKTMGNPMSSKEVMEAVKEAWGDGDIRSWRQNMATEIRKWAGPLQARFDGAVEEKQSELKSAQNEKLRERITIAIADLQDRRAKVQAQVASVIEQLTEYAPGRPLVMVNRDDPDVRHNGVVVGVDWERAQENPNAKSKIMVRIAIAAPEREVRLSLSSLTSPSGPYDVTFFNNLQNTVEMFDSVPREMREDRGIITGNLLAGYEKFPKGRIVMFTRNDGTTESGILMPRNFNLAVELEKAPVPLGTASDVMKFIDKDQSEGGGYSYYATAASVDGVVSVTRNSRGFYVITVRAKGGRKYAEHSIVAKEFGEMTKRGSREYTQVSYDRSQVERVIDAYIKDLRASFQAETNKGFAREVMGIEMPDTSVAEVKASMSKRSDRQSQPVESPAQVKRDLDRIADEIGREIGRTTGQKVSFHLSEEAYNFGKGYEALDGYFLDGVIGVSASAPDGPVGIARHEVIHALRSRDLFGGEAGAFSKEEWRTLVRAARKNKRLRDQVDQFYEGKSESIKIEEVVAEMYREWSDGRDAGLSDAEKSAFQTLKRVLDAIINVLRGNGMQTAADVFERVRSGEVGGRGPDGGGQVFDGDPVANPELMASISKMWGGKPTSRTDASLDKKEASFVSNLITNAMASNDKMNTLGLVPGEVLFRDLGKALPSAAKWVSRMRKMTSERQEMHAESDKLAQEWLGVYVKDKENGRKLHDLMHEATIAGVDPSIRFVAPKRRADMSQKDYRTVVENAKVAYGDLKQKYDVLPQNMKAIFGKARDAYRKFDDDLMNAMVDSVAKAMDLQASRLKANYEAELQQIKDDGLEGDARDFARKKARSRYNQDVKMLEFSRNARIRKMRLTYESNRIDGPYFPLMRFGQFFVAARDKKGKLVHFERATTVGVQQRIEADMKAEGFTVETGVIKPEDNMSRFVDPNFVADVQDLLGEVGDNGEVLDAIYQRYLETLPSFSIRKANIHRKGVPGFDKDAIKAFSSKMFHGAHQLARLRHSMDLTRHIEDARREAKDAPNPTRAGAIANEMQKRHEWSLNPQGASWSAWATSVSFVWYLGLTPGAAIVNLTQTTVVGIPILAAGIKGGSVAKAAKALSGALADFTAGLAKGDAEWSRGALTSGRLSDDERKALQAAYNSGALDKSQAHDIAAIGDSGVQYSAVREKAMRPIAFLFHHAERLNREVTFLAAYRMSKESGLDPEQATVQAGNLTWDTHFNYENWSRPRFMQGDVARVAFVFRQFQVNMLYRLFRDTHQALKGESEEVRKQARAQLIGMTGSMMLHAGITGTWGYALMMLLAGMFFDGGKDEAEEELKNAVVSMFGAGAGGMILKGVPGHLTGTDLTSRIGMPELWFRSPDRQMEGKEAYNYWVEQLLGAFPAIGASIFRGASMVGDGEVWRGVELMVPKAVRDQMRFMRYLNEGVTTYKGDPLLDNVSAHDALKQAIGFSPARVSERYEQNRRMMNMQMGVQDERRRILSDVTRYLREGKAISPRAWRKVREFNEKYPTYAITGATIDQSLSARLRASQQMEGGIRLNPRLEGPIRSQMAPSLYD
ncbi:PLxRFG domain-containing protein [Yoonia sp.]|uniref:PLxRFG domain-containing protein n=1 Tax=Yoonia sp. TaxID=2212373 RepID=UPI002E066BA1|nr:PLxRFG domain-containing protein [Yoonia sp.]